MEWKTKRVLILVKTYPSPSAKYQEVVCTAGIADTGELIRIYPIKFRYLSEDQKFEKYRWIEARVKRNPQDKRPESYKVDYDSIKLLDRIDSKDYTERLKWVLPHVSPSMEDIYQRHETKGITLGMFIPKSVTDLVIEKSSNEDWTDKERNTLNQLAFGDSEVTPLEKIPYEFSFKFTCDDSDCKSHKMRITDWEICQAYRNFTRKYGEKEGIQKLKDKYLNWFTDPNTNTYFLVGTVHRWSTFIIIGVTNLNNRTIVFPQMSLF